MRGTGMSICRFSAPAGRTLIPPRIVPVADAVRAAAGSPIRLVGSGAGMMAAAWPKGMPPVSIDERRAADIDWVARLGAAANESQSRAEAALPARARCAAAKRVATSAPMKTFFVWLRRLFADKEPVLTDASPNDAAAIGHLHGQSFRRGWSEDEVERLLLDRSVIAHRATVGRVFAGFVMSRVAAGEAEILSVAVCAPNKGRGLAGRLLRHHLGRLAGARRCARFFWKWTKTMRPLCDFIAGPDSAKSAGARAIIQRQAAKPRMP